MAKITAFWDKSAQGHDILVLHKKRGKIALSDLTEYFLYERQQHGFFVFLVRASEEMCGGSGWPMDTPEGDFVELYEYISEENCPICGQVAPPEYCPHCGEQFSERYGQPPWTRCVDKPPKEGIPVLVDCYEHKDPIVARFKVDEDGAQYFLQGEERHPLHNWMYWMPLPARKLT